MIETCDKATIHVVTDNLIDGMGEPTKTIERHGLTYHFAAGHPAVQGSLGLCFVIDAYIGDRRKRILMDGGWSAEATLHNMKIMGIDPKTIETVVLSHGHPDHYLGLYQILEEIGYTVPLYVHPDAFYPRTIVRKGGFSSDVFNRDLSVAKLEAAGAKVAQVKSPVPLMAGVIFSGQIERTVDFEREVPKGRYAIHDGVLQDDEILDDSAIILNVKDKGLVIALGCGHAGAINTIKYAQKLTGEEKVHTVLGGLHVGHLGYSSPRLFKTFEALKAMGVKQVVPTHCSGLCGRSKAAEIMPDEYVGIGAASSLHF